MIEQITEKDRYSDQIISDEQLEDLSPQMIHKSGYKSVMVFFNNWMDKLSGSSYKFIPAIMKKVIDNAKLKNDQEAVNLAEATLKTIDELQADVKIVINEIKTEGLFTNEEIDYLLNGLNDQEIKYFDLSKYDENSKDFDIRMRSKAVKFITESYIRMRKRGYTDWSGPKNLCT